MSCNGCGKKISQFSSNNLFTWCTNCGNYGINNAIKRALAGLNIEPHRVIMCFDVGCNGNGSDKIQAYSIHGLHGRIIPLACGASLATDLPVIASAGDGATFSEGINHLVHAIRNNYDITFILHNNENYALTTGQASSTTPKGVKMNISPDGVLFDPIHVAHFVLNLKPSFYARGYSGSVNQLSMLIKQGIQHKGFSFIEVLQDCPTYNHSMTHDWYLQRIYDLNETHHDYKNLSLAWQVTEDLSSKIATGLVYKDTKRKDFYSMQPNRDNYKTSLIHEVKNDYQKIAMELYKKF